jgi:hypothetical protein
MTLVSGQPHKVSSLVGAPNGLTWSADDKGLIYSLGFELPPNELGEVAISTGSIRRLVLTGGVELPTALWTLSPGGIYFVPADAPRSLRYFDFATKEVRNVFEVDNDFGSGLSLSPDGRWIMYSQVGDVNSDIMLVENYR